MLFAMAMAVSGVFAQDGPPANEFVSGDPDSANRSEVLRRELRLSPEQMRQIREVNVSIRPRMREAQKAFRLARRDLDAAIYADNLDEEALRIRVKDVVEAQAEVTRLRTMSEVAVRKILSPEQLVRFRELRLRFQRIAEEKAKAAERRRTRRQMRRDRRDPPPPPRDQP